MDGPYAATVQFKSNTKNCFISVPSAWIQHGRHDSVIVFEVQRGDGKSVYLSWSGDVVPSNDTIALNGFFALKLGLGEGEEVIVTRRRELSTLETLNVEPVSIDDWEILELHTTFIQDNILNQVRVVWNSQILPIWVNQSVCIIVRISELTPSCEVGLLINSTELHITPKTRKSKLDVLPYVEDNISTPAAKPRPSSLPMGIAQSTVVPEQEKKWFLSNTLNNALRSLFPTRQSKDIENQNTIQGEIKEEVVIKDKSSKRRVTVRIHPMESLLECINTEDTNSPNTNNLRILLLQPTNVLVTAKTCHLNGDQQTNPVLLGKLTNTVEMSDGLRPTKTDKQSSLKVKKECYVKVVLLDYLLEYSEAGSEMGRLLTRLINEQADGAMFVPANVRRYIQCAVTTRVQLQIIGHPKTVKPTTIHLFPLNDVTIKMSDVQTTKEKTKEMNEQIDNWRNNICSLSCPLILFNKYIVTVPINGINHDFIVQSSTTNEDQPDSTSAIIMVTPATRFQPKWDILVKDPNLTWANGASDWDTVVIGLPSVALGGFGGLIAESKTYMKMCLILGPLASHLRVGQCNLGGGGLLICGSAGSGKSSIARAMARDFSQSPYYVYCDYISCKAMKGKRAESIVKAWKKSFSEAHRRHPAIIILDDLDHLVGMAVGPENEIGIGANYRARLADTLKELMRSCFKAKVAVVTVATSKSVNSLHPSLISAQGVHLFQKVVNIPSPNIDERVDILKHAILSKPLASSNVIESNDMDWSSLATKMEGYVARDLNVIVDRALHSALSRSGHSQDDSDLTITQEDIERATIDYLPIALRSLNIHKPGEKCWNDVGGLKYVKKTLVETLQWPSKYPDLFARCPLAMRSGILIYGPPGTGKTLLAGVVAKECNMNFISIKGPELLSKYIGASEQAVRDLFERAANAKPCVIFFDEFDSLAPRRGHDSTGVTDRVVNQLLTQMDGVEGRKDVYVLAATSRPDLIDPALLRPGRLDKCLYCPLPTAEEREEILTALSRPMNLSDDVNLSLLANPCEYFSGADLQGLLYNAQMNAIHQTFGQLYSMDKSLLEMDYVICKKENGASTKLKEHEYEMIHFRSLEDGPEETDLEYLKSQKQKVTCILSNVEKLSTGRTNLIEPNDDDDGGRRPTVMVHQHNLMDAVKEMRPSVGPEDRKRYDLIYEAFIKSRGGHFDTGSTSLQTLSGYRATLA